MLMSVKNVTVVIEMQNQMRLVQFMRVFVTLPEIVGIKRVLTVIQEHRDPAAGQGILCFTGPYRIGG